MTGAQFWTIKLGDFWLRSKWRCVYAFTWIRSNVIRKCFDWYYQYEFINRHIVDIIFAWQFLPHQALYWMLQQVTSYMRPPTADGPYGICKSWRASVQLIVDSLFTDLSYLYRSKTWKLRFCLLLFFEAVSTMYILTY